MSTSEIEGGRPPDQGGVEVRDLALLRFDFVPIEDRDEVVRRLSEAFGEPEGALEDGRWQVFIGDPARFGFEHRFDSLTVRVGESTDAVTEVRTLLTGAPRLGHGRTVLGRTDWRGIERDLESVRSFIPGEPRGPETTVWWVGIDPLPDAFRNDPTGIGSVGQILPTEPDPVLREVVEICADRGSVELDGMAVLIPGGTDPAVGRLAGRLVALDIAGNVGLAVESRGRELRGSWSAVSTLLAVEYWARATSDRIEAFEDRLESGVDRHEWESSQRDLWSSQETVSTVFGLQGEWSDLEARLVRELRGFRRRLRQFQTETAETSAVRIADGEIRDTSGVLKAYLDRLEAELEGTRLDMARVSDRLAAISTLLSTRATLIAARENLALQRAMEMSPGEGSSREPLTALIAAIIGLVALVLAADALMSGGLERFVDRLFDEGLAAFTPQVLAGFGVVLLVFVIALAARRRVAIVAAVSGRRR